MISAIAKTSALISTVADNTQSLEDIAAKAASPGNAGEVNLGFLIMYEQWKQEILLSDGMTEDYNSEW
ncbi:hypothetical protein [unidentified bacterial endosymbiont]|jgi:hypothetical protein|uniref:hypothetical protein n=1 Tax=unidentified bacterial endosymbiont TaxID=2355 RepID=UPI00209D5BE8|nr:hypothetical protein [unidentified bacterial endosymbiont]